MPSMPCLPSSRGPAALLLALGLFAAAPASAQSAADKATARQLMVDGRALREQGELSTALEKFKAADAIMHVPTTGLDLAKTHVLLKHLLEAQEALLAVRRYKLAPKDPDAYRTAQTAAAALEEEIAPRIPSLVINVSGPPESADLKVTVDGESVPKAALSQPRKVNPGKHRVLASAAGFPSAERGVEISEKETKYVELTLTAGAAPVQPPRDASKGGVPTWAWVAGGIGVVGVGVSIGFRVDLNGVKDDIAKQCPGGECPSQELKASLASHYNRSLALTILFAAVGAGGLGASLYGIVTAPKKEPRAAVLPWMGPDAAGAMVMGRF